jgi:hypothetical protein
VLIKPPQITNHASFSRECYATTFDISESDKKVISDQITDLFGTTIHVNMANVKCTGIFTEFWRSLAF